jgi:hypothetical protein
MKNKDQILLENLYSKSILKENQKSPQQLYNELRSALINKLTDGRARDIVVGEYIDDLRKQGQIRIPFKGSVSANWYNNQQELDVVIKFLETIFEGDSFYKDILQGIQSVKSVYQSEINKNKPNLADIMGPKQIEAVDDYYKNKFKPRINENSSDWTTSIKNIINNTNQQLGELTRSDDPVLKQKATTLYTILQHWANLNISPETRKFVSDQFAISPRPVSRQEADMYQYQQKQMDKGK